MRLTFGGKLYFFFSYKILNCSSALFQPSSSHLVLYACVCVVVRCIEIFEQDESDERQQKRQPNRKRIVNDGNLNESARDQLEIVNQPSQQSLEHDVKTLDNEKYNFPPTYEETMK